MVFGNSCLHCRPQGSDAGDLDDDMDKRLLSLSFDEVVVNQKTQRHRDREHAEGERRIAIGWYELHQYERNSRKEENETPLQRGILVFCAILLAKDGLGVLIDIPFLNHLLFQNIVRHHFGEVIE